MYGNSLFANLPSASTKLNEVIGGSWWYSPALAFNVRDSIGRYDIDALGDNCFHIFAVSFENEATSALIPNDVLTLLSAALYSADP